MATTYARWNGDQAEGMALADASNHNCTCKYDGDGFQSSTCGVHLAIKQNQRFLDGILWGRHIAQRLLCEEFGFTK